MSAQATDDALGLAEAISDSSAVRLAGLCTHLAVADEPDDPFTLAQLELFDDVLTALAVAGHHPPLLHTANSAATLAFPESRFNMVRAGIAVYGVAPSPALDRYTATLRPALSLRARVSHVKSRYEPATASRTACGTVSTDTTVATLPLGYADGVPRRLFSVAHWSGSSTRPRFTGLRCM